MLYTSKDMVNYEPLHELNLDLETRLNEATIRFTDNGKAYMIVRNEKKEGTSYIGKSNLPL